MLRSVRGAALFEHRRGLLGWSIGIAAFVLLSLAFYPSIRENATQFQAVIDQMPAALRSVFLGEVTDITSPVGYLNGRLFASTMPVLVLVFVIGWGSRAVAGEEEAHTLDLLLSMPVTRRRVFLEKFAALAAGLGVVCLATWASLAIFDIPFGVDVGLGALAAVTVHLFVFGLVFGAIGLALGAASGRRGVAAGITSGVAALAFILSSIAPLSPDTRWLQTLSPLYYYAGSTPLLHGVDPLHIGVLALLTVAALAGGTWAFDHRDLRA
ncbi:MAG TPA: ABC transporter permease subunit [Actinomycetota bacterium]|nr:ABC transporter permease subunit [Actinomycetota bacterium]